MLYHIWHMYTYVILFGFSCKPVCVCGFCFCRSHIPPKLGLALVSHSNVLLCFPPFKTSCFSLPVCVCVWLRVSPGSFKWASRYAVENWASVECKRQWIFSLFQCCSLWNLCCVCESVCCLALQVTDWLTAAALMWLSAAWLHACVCARWCIHGWTLLRSCSRLC